MDTDWGGGGHLDFDNIFMIIKYKYIVVVDRFHIALFSALEQTHCACM